VSLTVPVFGSPVEPYAPWEPPDSCDTQAFTPGVLRFRAFVLEKYGGSNLGIGRPCINNKPVSHHNANRAWDWKMAVSDPQEKEAADSLIAWLLATGPAGEPHEMLRRIGLRYIIWNGQGWYASSKKWKPYTGSCPHVRHVHFSFSKLGASGKTSFYDWLSAGEPVEIKDPKPLPFFPADSPVPPVAGFIAGLLGTIWLSKRIR